MCAGIEHRLVAGRRAGARGDPSPAAASVVTIRRGDRLLPRTARPAAPRPIASTEPRLEPVARAVSRPSATTASPTSGIASSATARHAVTTCSIVIPVSPSPSGDPRRSAHRGSARCPRPCRRHRRARSCVVSTASARPERTRGGRAEQRLDLRHRGPAARSSSRPFPSTSRNARHSGARFRCVAPRSRRSTCRYTMSSSSSGVAPRLLTSTATRRGPARPPIAQQPLDHGVGHFVRGGDGALLPRRARRGSPSRSRSCRPAP